MSKNPKQYKQNSSEPLSSLAPSDGGGKASSARWLLGLTGLSIDGGIASVARSVTLALEETVLAGQIERADRILLFGNSANRVPKSGTEWHARGNYWAFVIQLWVQFLRRPSSPIFFDQLGPARSMQLPLPGFGLGKTPRYAVFCHGIEIERAVSGNYRKALTNAWRILVNSEFTGRLVRADFPELGERIRVLPLCVEVEKVQSWEASPIDPDIARQPAALIVGRMVAEEPGKGHETLIDAWSSVASRCPDARLWIVGGGDDVPRLQDRVRSSGLEGSVQFLGRISDSELSDRYRRASVFAMPSQQEGFGLVYAEAMWHGLPCIASAADAGAETVDDSETGIVVPYGDVAATADAIVRLLEDRAQARRMGENAARVARTRYAYPRFRQDLLRALDIIE